MASVAMRALETVRGVIKAVWLNGENPYDAGRRIWSHPERDGADIDLTVMTTNEVPESKDDRVVDFHELYWAHLMSETKPVAVLLWLYELCRKGPIMKEGINGLWWAASIFLCFLSLSVALLALKGAVQFARICTLESMLVAPFLLIFSSLVLGLAVALKWRALRLSGWLALFCGIDVIAIAAYFGARKLWGDRWLELSELLTVAVLPTLIAFVATCLLARRHGRRAFYRAFWISLIVAGIVSGVDLFLNWSNTSVAASLTTAWPWGLDSPGALRSRSVCSASTSSLTPPSCNHISAMLRATSGPHQPMSQYAAGFKTGDRHAGQAQRLRQLRSRNRGGSQPRHRRRLRHAARLFQPDLR